MILGLDNLSADEKVSVPISGELYLYYDTHFTLRNIETVSVPISGELYLYNKHKNEREVYTMFPSPSLGSFIYMMSCFYIKK